MGKRKKTKWWFLPILGILPKPLLVSAAGTVRGEILKGLGSKIFGGGRKRRQRRRKRNLRWLTYA